MQMIQNWIGLSVTNKWKTSKTWPVAQHFPGMTLQYLDRRNCSIMAKQSLLVFCRNHQKVVGGLQTERWKWCHCLDGALWYLMLLFPRQHWTLYQALLSFQSGSSVGIRSLACLCSLLRLWWSVSEKVQMWRAAETQTGSWLLCWTSTGNDTGLLYQLLRMRYHRNSESEEVQKGIRCVSWGTLEQMSAGLWLNCVCEGSQSSESS